MIEFKISAPGRIVLSGEHAMLYQKRTIMASLDRRTTLKFCELPDEQKIIKIEFTEVNLSLNVPLKKVRNFLFCDDMNNIISNNIRLTKYVKHFITLNGMWSTNEQRFSLKLFFLLLSAFVYHEKLEIRPFHVNVTTELSISGGLGSSTSFGVCLTACFIHWTRLQKGAHDDFDKNDLEKIRLYTTIYEEYIQDFTFPMDIHVCIYGKIVNFQCNTCERTDVWPMDVPKIKILLIDTNICQNNRERLRRMAELKHSQSKYANHRLNKIDEITRKICKKLDEIITSHKNPNPTSTSLILQATAYAELQELIQENQRILRISSLSHPTLDNICSIAQSYGFAGKLTGFRGGFVYILLPPSTQEEQIRNLSTELEAKGFNVTTTSVSCSGMKIDD
ncbi:unnamed protein product [Lasius platythorax]|uniref:GHMP kinase C-terminal domain-containing protein n=1 Tax=Lasius platythorax TaxID=488582 RepID=A0AAV2PBR4_9HYME